MLLILLVVNLLSQDGIAAPLPHPPDARATTDSCNDINDCRTLFSVVWGCFVTIFACTWVSVHPNAPPPDRSSLQLFWRRLKMMLIAIIAPEIMVGFAGRQFFASQRLSRGDVEYTISKTHGFFVCMGGFVSSTGYPIATIEQLEDPALGSEFQKAIRNVNKEHIKDKSKGDALSKGVVLLQGLWFILQCIARVHQRLAVTQLEVATLAFAIVNIFICLLWWNKPLDVQQSIVVGPCTLPDAETKTLPVQLSRFERIGAAIFGNYHPQSSVAVPSFWSVNYDTGTEASFLLLLVGTVFGTIHCAAWNAVFPTLAEMWIWRTSSLVIVAIPGFISLLIVILARLYWEEEDSVPVVFQVMILAAPIYIAARMILIVSSLADLRSLPASAFVDVNWSMYVPHI
ncbi:hypothetical protein C8R45DRAFT_900268 [Mycena sanguinolenta]|nr:hypothetical protein C8R45DRAFT_900268 [Mycena sanguinolenta]